MSIVDVDNERLDNIVSEIKKADNKIDELERKFKHCKDKVKYDGNNKFEITNFDNIKSILTMMSTYMKERSAKLSKIIENIEKTKSVINTYDSTNSAMKGDPRFTVVLPDSSDKGDGKNTKPDSSDKGDGKNTKPDSLNSSNTNKNQTSSVSSKGDKKNKKKEKIKEYKNKIKASLKDGKQKTANKYYKKLRKIQGKEKAKVWLKKQITSINKKAKFKIKLKKNLISIVKKTNKADAVATAATISEAAICLSPFKGTSETKILDILQNSKNEKLQYIKEKEDAINKVYEEAFEKIKNVDPNAEDASDRIDEIQTNVNDKIIEINEDYNDKIEAVNESEEETIKEINDKYDEYRNSDSDGNKDIYVLNENVHEQTEDLNTFADLKQAGNDEVELASQKIDNLNTSNSDKFTAMIESKNKEIANAANGISEQPVPSENTNTQEVVATKVTESTEVSQAPASNEEEPVQYSNNRYSSSSNVSSNANDNFVTNDGPREGVTASTTPNNNSTTVGAETTEPDKNSTLSVLKENVISITDNETSGNSKSSKNSSGLGSAIPIGLGIGAIGAATVAGVRYAKNRKQNIDIDEDYDDENNDGDNVSDSGNYEEVSNDSAYMRDDYLGPEGSSYSEVPDETSYMDTNDLEEEAGMNMFSEDTALNELD